MKNEREMNILQNIFAVQAIFLFQWLMHIVSVFILFLER